eukprot:5852972-Amphidinium_carterae.1
MSKKRELSVGMSHDVRVPTAPGLDQALNTRSTVSPEVSQTEKTQMQATPSPQKSPAQKRGHLLCPFRNMTSIAKGSRVRARFLVPVACACAVLAVRQGGSLGVLGVSHNRQPKQATGRLPRRHSPRDAGRRCVSKDA